MILTVTPNTALDRILFVDDFAIGRTARATGAAEGWGGPSTSANSACPTRPPARRRDGPPDGRHPRGRRWATDFLCAGETRTNYVIARTSDGAQDGHRGGPRGHPADERLSSGPARLGACRFLLCGGSLAGLPVDWYAPLIARAREMGVTTLLDASGPHLAANVAARPHIIKPNADEAESLLGRPIDTLEAAAEGACALRARGIETVAITLGERGAVVATDEGLFHLPPLPVRVVNTAGAGDGFNAGLLMARARGDAWPAALRQAAAVATSILLTPGTGECRPADVATLLPQIQLTSSPFERVIECGRLAAALPLATLGGRLLPFLLPPLRPPPSPPRFWTTKRIRLEYLTVNDPRTRRSP